MASASVNRGTASPSLSALAASQCDHCDLAAESGKSAGLSTEWAQRFPERTAALIRAGVRGAQWCEQPTNHAELARLLSQPRYIGAPADALLNALGGQLRLRPPHGGAAD